MLIASAFLCVLLLTPRAFADDPAYRPCEVCLTKEEGAALKAKSLRGEGNDRQREIAKEAEAEKSRCEGRLEESRRSVMLCDQKVDDLSGRPSWWTVTWIGGAALVIGGIAGALAF